MTKRLSGRFRGLEARRVDLATPVSPMPVAVRAGRWPARRLLAAVALVVLMAIVVAVAPGWDLAGAPLWSALTLGTIFAAALALATYVPAQGWRPDLGCGSCATVSALAAVAGTWLAMTSGFDGGTASLGLALAGASLAKRLTDPDVCV